MCALRWSDLGLGVVTIARGVVIGALDEQNRRRFEGHLWPAGRERGKPTALIEKNQDEAAADDSSAGSASGSGSATSGCICSTVSWRSLGAGADLLAFASFPRSTGARSESNTPWERRTDVVGIFPNRAAVIRVV